MALITEIRKRSWILIVMVAAGMGGFLLMDMIGNNQSAFNTSTDVGKIDGRRISLNEFNARDQEFYGNSQLDGNQRRAGVWEYFIQETILLHEADALGMKVTNEELNELFQPNQRLSRVVYNEFGGSQNQFDQEVLKNALKNISQFNDEQRAYWKGLEDRVIVDRLGEKITNLVSKGIYTPTWLAEMTNVEESERVDFQVVGIPYAAINDAEVKVTDSDLNAYIKRHSYRYQQEEETRLVDFVAFNVIPTAADSATHFKRLQDLATEFATAEDDSAFVLNSYGTIDIQYFKKEEISPAIADTLFDLQKGAVYGPYLEGTAYKVVKILDKKILADSVRARHILIKINNNDPNGLQTAQTTADSLKNLLEKGAATFDSLAAKHGTDATRDKGGDLGYAASGTYVKPFNDLVFYKAVPNKLYTVTTEFGVHVVELTDVKTSNVQGVQVAYLSESILPSKDTRSIAREKAYNFVRNSRTVEAMREAAKKEGLEVRTSPPLKKADFDIAGLEVSEDSRNIVKWAYQAKVGDVAKNLYTFQDAVEGYEKMFVVAALAAKRAPGLASANDVREEVERLVINEKKAEVIKSKIKAGSSLEQIGAEFKTQPTMATGVTFSQAFVEGLGNEPTVVARAFKSELNKISAPINGIAGVFVINLTSKTPATSISDLADAKKRISSSVASQANASLFEGLKKTITIKDTRSKFF